MNAPTPWVDDPSLTEASGAFRGFFHELRQVFLEREGLFTQLELALLCREHVLIIGPPGTAKSAIASSVLGRIVDEKTGAPSLFSKQLTESTVQTDLIGPVDFKVLTETGRTEHLTDEGMLGAVHAFLDEVFDGRDMLLRSILNVLQERELKHGRKVTVGRCECAVLTSNRYLSEVLQRSPETLQAFADRVSFVSFAPKSFARRSSRAQMLQRAQSSQRPVLQGRLTLQQLDRLQALVDAVEVPAVVAEGLEELADALERELLAQVVKLPDYVPTKYFSQRSMVKALWVLKALVVRDRIYRRPERRLVAEVSDLEGLRHFFLLGGPAEGELEALIKAAADPRERAQLEIIRVEHRTFAHALGKLAPSVQQSTERETVELRVKELTEAAESVSKAWAAANVSTTARALRERLLPGPRHEETRKSLLRIAASVIQATQQRAMRGPKSAAEPHGLVAIAGAFQDVLELVRRVPELQSWGPATAETFAEFAREAAALTAVLTEGLELDDALRIDGVVTHAETVLDELERLTELVQSVGEVVPELSNSGLAALGQGRRKVALALRRRAIRAFAPSAPGKSWTALELLRADGRRLLVLEQFLVRLSGDIEGIRETLLTPLAERYVTESFSANGLASLEQLHGALQLALDELVREGVEPGPALGRAHRALEERIAAIVRGSTSPAVIPLEPGKALSGDHYATYQRTFATVSGANELKAFDALNALLSSHRAPPLAQTIRGALATIERSSLERQVAFLVSWWSAIEGQLPPVAKLTSRADAERAFDALMKSRLPMLITRDGALVHLDASLRRLTARDGGSTEASAALGRVDAAFSRYARDVLDVRARK